MSTTFDYDKERFIMNEIVDRRNLSLNTKQIQMLINESNAFLEEFSHSVDYILKEYVEERGIKIPRMDIFSIAYNNLNVYQ